MDKKIALLRGINVGSNKRILMADLKLLFKGLGFTNITTYIQSGNVFFDVKNKLTNKQIGEKIEKAIADTYGFAVPVLIKSPKEIETAINENPFYNKDADINKLHLTFLSKTPTNEDLAVTNAYNYQPDKFLIKDDNVFIFCENKYHQSKLTNTFFEKKLHVATTTRNWKTVLKLAALSKTD